MSTENGHISDDSPKAGFTEMRAHLNEALRLLGDEEHLTVGASLPSNAGYPSQHQAGADSDSQRLPEVASREAALKELKAVSELVDTLEKRFTAMQEVEVEVDAGVDFESRIESAPEYTREWLLSQFTDSEHGSDAGRSGRRRKSGSLNPEEPKNRCPDISDFVISDEIVHKGLHSPDVVEFLGTAGQPEFDALAFAKLEHVNRRGITILGVYCEEKQGLIKQMQIDGNISDSKAFEAAYENFFMKIDQLYKADALYHGAAHAMDVMSTSTWFMKSDSLKHCRALEHFMVLVAAAIHDVGHPGVNNTFLSKTMDSIAIRYNDKSCLENMHLSIAFELMQKDPVCNWFGMLEKTDKAGQPNPRKVVREGLIGMVLATDMATHARYVLELDDIIKERSSCTEEELDKLQFPLDLVVHSSDISNPAKPRPVMLAWTKRVNAEFWTQGDQEANMGLDISPLCDRAEGRRSVPQGQIGFVNFVVMPFYKKIAEIIPEAQAGVDALTATVSFWKDMVARGATFDEIFEGIEPSIQC